MEYLRLDEMCNIDMGQSPDSSSYNQEGKGIPFYQGNADFGDIYPVTRVWCNKPIKVVEKGTLLISVRAPIGALNFASVQSCIGRGLAGITAKNELNLKYIYYALKYKRKELNNKGTGSTFKALSKSSLGEILIKDISIEEQIDCVKILDLIYNLITGQKDRLRQLEILVRARFVEMFGDVATDNYKYETRKLGDVADVGSSHRVFTTEFVDSGIPFYRGTEIGELANGIKPTEPYYISEEHYNRLAKDDTKPQIGELQ